MNVALLVGGGCNILVALLSIGLSIPLALRRVGVNNLYGVRIRKSFQSQEYWEKINAYFAWRMIFWCIPVLLVGVAMVVIGMRWPEVLPGMRAYWLNLSLLFTVIPAIQTYIWSRELP